MHGIRPGTGAGTQPNQHYLQHSLTLELFLAKEKVEGSNPFSRSNHLGVGGRGYGKIKAYDNHK